MYFNVGYRRMLSTTAQQDITILLKALPKVTGNGPFAAKPKFTPLKATKGDIGTNSNTVINIPSNSSLNFNGSIVSLFTTTSNYSQLSESLSTVKSQSGKFANSSTQQITTKIPLSVIVSNNHACGFKIVTINGDVNAQQHDNAKQANTSNAINSWKIFKQNNILGYNVQRDGQYDLVMTYDSLLKVKPNEAIFIDQKSLIAINSPQWIKYQLIKPKIYKSFFLTQFSRKAGIILNEFFNWGLWKHLSFRKLQLNIIQDNHRQLYNEYVTENFKSLNLYLTKLKNIMRPFVKPEKQHLVRVVGPANVFITK